MFFQKGNLCYLRILSILNTPLGTEKEAEGCFTKEKGHKGKAGFWHPGLVINCSLCNRTGHDSTSKHWKNCVKILRESLEYSKVGRLLSQEDLRSHFTKPYDLELVTFLNLGFPICVKCKIIWSWMNADVKWLWNNTYEKIL